MDQRTDRRTDRPTDGSTDGWIDQRTDRPTDGPTPVVLELLRAAKKVPAYSNLFVHILEQISFEIMRLL